MKKTSLALAALSMLTADVGIPRTGVSTIQEKRRRRRNEVSWAAHIDRGVHRAAGSKLARKAREGRLGLSTIR